MRIDSIHLTNYRRYASLQVDFEPGFNVIAGINGSGKTSLLTAVCDALTGFGDQISIPSYPPLMNVDVARLKVETVNGRYRFEPQYPVEVSATVKVFDTECTWAVQKVSQVNPPQINGRPSGRILQTMHLATKQQALPVLAFYRASRHWNQPRPNEMQAATTRTARMDGYASWWDASLDSTALQSWVIGKCLERFQTSSESGTPFDSIRSDELALVNQALTAAVEGAKGLKYDLKQKSLLVEWSGTPGSKDEAIAFENLSDGQRAVIGLVADIARRMCILNPQLDQAVTDETPGVVLIDELDVHLHPQWQRILTRGLKRAFPKVQFIAASHSPQVLGELKPDEIILLCSDETSHPQVSYGLTSSQVLEEIMGAGARTPEIEKRLSEVIGLLERNELQQAREKLGELEREAPGIPEFIGAQALLRRKEVLGR